ncbi:hypothetical protein PsorP6_014091 [Peronosclerospora sorghi]|uniref:Uncharacterized protein n=1 Tax=Peronosclerospora sorghi TaxID=230839 RepID=A0ACC0VGF8_9STRA|nr:hypothetical protein PsorP6_014091 [Peronosclerospora sorghi]
MPATALDIDDLNLDLSITSPSSKYAATAPPNSTSNYSDVSYKGTTTVEDDELHGETRSTSHPTRPSVDHPHACSFDLQEMINMRESTLRDSLVAGNGGDDHSSGGRPTEMGNALMRMDDNYRRAYNNHRRSVGGPAPDGLTPLLQAARAGDIVLVNALIIQPGTDILRRDPLYGQTALHFAIRGGHLNVVQALLMPELRGSIVNVADNRRNTALHLAAAKSRRLTKVLVECGADVNFLNMRNQTPLGVHILTCTKDDPTMTEILLQHRANSNAPVDKSTILHVALDKGLIQIATRLVRHGARLDLKDESGKTVFDKVDKPYLQMLMAKVSHAPTWIADKERSECMECHKKFKGLGPRRHHCRMCGRLLCSSCSACHLRGMKLPFLVPRRGKKQQVEKGSAKTRVCSMCHTLCAAREPRPSSDVGASL